MNSEYQITPDGEFGPLPTMIPYEKDGKTFYRSEPVVRWRKPVPADPKNFGPSDDAPI